jgi:hypothetical protein
VSNPIEDDEQCSLRIQREVGVALRRTFDTMTREPLPEQMTLLLLRLALAQAIRMSLDAEESAAEAVAGVSIEDEPIFAQIALAGGG